ncbi:hypothetical protein ACFQU7_35590 [Pseudoroseomonas wenyumeiae]
MRARPQSDSFDFGKEPPASPTNLEIITGVSHVLKRMLFARCGAEDEP